MAEFKELTAEEVAEWERLCDDNFESYEHETLDDEARELYEMGADLGDGQASVNLGYIYYYGRGSEGVSYAKALALG